MSLTPINPHSANDSNIQNGISALNSGGAYPVGPHIGQEPTQGIDLYGALMRRKFLVLLLAIVGSGLGYLYFSKQPIVYSSRLTLMISENLPRVIGDNESILKSNTAPKHKHLILSDLVLENAVDEGRLKSLAMFRDVSSPASALKRSVTIHSPSGDDETIVIQCAGPNSEELPTVLNQIVQAYRDALDQLSRDSSQEFVELIQKFQDSTVREKQSLQDRYMELSKKNGLTARLEDGDLINPFVSLLYESRKERDRVSRRFDEVDGLLTALNKTVESKEPAHVAVLVIEAQKYIGSGATLPAIDRRRQLRENTLTGNYAQQVSEIRRTLYRLAAERRDLKRVYGSGSPHIKSIDSNIAAWSKELAKMERAQSELAAAPTDVGENAKKIRAAQETYWILIYSISLTKEKQKLAASLAKLNEQVGENEKQANVIAGDIAEMNLLKRQIAEKREAASVILDQIKGIKLVSNDYQKYNILVTEKARAGVKVAPKLYQDLGMGIMFGALIGMGLALLVDRMDMNFRNPSEILERLGVAVVGRIPRIRARGVSQDVQGSPTLIAAHKPNSSSAEAFRAVRTAMFFAASNGKASTFLFTSPSPGDGKSTVCSNLAISIAQTGKRVLLIDADFRRPRVHQYFGEDATPGILGVMSGENSLRECIHESMQENLFLLPAGGRPKNPGELVTSPDFDKILLEVRKEFDFVLIDSPPVLPVADPTVLATKVDGVYLVIRIRKGVRVSAQNAKDNLDRVDAKTIGIIVNGLDENPHYTEYGYSYYYPYNAGYQRYYDSEAATPGRPKAISS